MISLPSLERNATVLKRAPTQQATPVG